MCACVEGVALNAILHTDGANILSKMLLGIAYDLLCHVVS